MGQRETAPPLPTFEAMLCPPEETELWARQRQCNWLQALEGDIDTSHFSFLHGGKVTSEDIDPSHPERFQFTDRAPRFQVRRTDWGTMYAAYRPANPGQFYYRFGHFAFPFWAFFPNGPLADNVLVQGWVPMDDTHTMAFTFSWSRKTPVLTRNKTGEPLPLLDRVTATLPNTADWFGRWRPVANRENDYLIDRAAQRTISYTGINGVFPQDSAVTEGMGEISDRKLETLAPSDGMIVATRRRLLDALHALEAHGTVPPGVDNPEITTGARAGDLLAPEGKPWLVAYEEELGRALHPLAQAAE
jgi:hypothetical protein